MHYSQLALTVRVDSVYAEYSKAITFLSIILIQSAEIHWLEFILVQALARVALYSIHVEQ
ncbi:hypothetical protein GNIT_0788 [Glaciecola nitratireducens FR1064]|uniref:Uncharacterized protein n=1 Tax=Glaciecola nitratireducens (strain JCM 12485 / KCTC 12276 / FR1064) TaxID=1085623 RepID=G4QJ65_GLANF|nr:hypothetical protein GNIT_0788 [Glaciecola nitratireducens FR1064]